MATTKTFARATSYYYVFVAMALLFAIATFARCPLSAQEADQPSPATQPADASGITKISHLGPALTAPDDSTKEQVLQYGLGFILQVAPRTAAVLCNVRTIGLGHWDFEGGTDAVVFDDLATIGRQKRVTLARNELDRNPATGKKRVAVTYPIVGGFVPLGAKLADGSAHPDAGTGFGLSQALCFDLNDQGYYTTVDARPEGQKPSAQRFFIHQFAYDGRDFRVVKVDMKPDNDRLKTTDGAWIITSPGLSSAIPDGADLLFPVVANDGKREASGVSRWRREGGDWRPVAFHAVKGTQALNDMQGAYPVGDCEPSVIRDVDGSLLYGARSMPEGQAVRVWRSRDSGKSWEQVFHNPTLRSNAPVVLHQAADGTPFIAADQPGSFRAKLCLWPLTADRTGCGPAMMIRDCVAEFGPPPAGTLWFADHPTSATVQLADGQWHRLLAHRVMAFNMAGVGKETPTPQTGCHIQEVFSAGPARPAWKF